MKQQAWCGAGATNPVSFLTAGGDLKKGLMKAHAHTTVESLSAVRLQSSGENPLTSNTMANIKKVQHWLHPLRMFMIEPQQIYSTTGVLLAHCITAWCSKSALPTRCLEEERDCEKSRESQCPSLFPTGGQLALNHH